MKYVNKACFMKDILHVHRYADYSIILKKSQATDDKPKIMSWYIEQSKKDFDHAEDVNLFFINFVCKKHAIPSITVVTKNDCFGVRSVKRLVSTIKFRGTR